MVLQYLSNAGDEGAKRDSIYEYLKDVLPQNKTEEQRLRTLGDLLKAMKKEKTDKNRWTVLVSSVKNRRNSTKITYFHRKLVEIVSFSS